MKKFGEFLVIALGENKKESEETMKRYGLDEDSKIGDEFVFVLTRKEDNEMGFRLKKK